MKHSYLSHCIPLCISFSSTSRVHLCRSDEGHSVLNESQRQCVRICLSWSIHLSLLVSKHSTTTVDRTKQVCAPHVSSMSSTPCWDFNLHSFERLKKKKKEGKISLKIVFWLCNVSALVWCVGWGGQIPRFTVRCPVYRCSLEGKHQKQMDRNVFHFGVIYIVTHAGKYIIAASCFGFILGRKCSAGVQGGVGLSNTACLHSWQTSAILLHNSFQPVALCSRVAPEPTWQSCARAGKKKIIIKAFNSQHGSSLTRPLIEDLWGKSSASAHLFSNSGGLIDWLKLHDLFMLLSQDINSSWNKMWGGGGWGSCWTEQLQRTALHKWEGCLFGNGSYAIAAWSALTAAPMHGQYEDASVVLTTTEQAILVPSPLHPHPATPPSFPTASAVCPCRALSNVMMTGNPQDTTRGRSALRFHLWPCFCWIRLRSYVCMWERRASPWCNNHAIHTCSKTKRKHPFLPLLCSHKMIRVKWKPFTWT